MIRLKTKLIELLLHNYDYFMVMRHKCDGCVMEVGDEEDRVHLCNIMLSAMQDDNAHTREIILNTAEAYLKPLEIESKNFIERIK